MQAIGFIIVYHTCFCRQIKVQFLTVFSIIDK